MLFSTIKIGDRLEITLLKDRKLNKSYISQVENIIKKEQIMMHVPISYGQLVKLPTNERYSMLFFTDRGMIRFDAEIRGYTKENGFNFMFAKLNSEGERIQRREFFRFSCLLPLKFALIEEEPKDSETNFTTLNDGILKDIGGGGVRFVSNSQVQKDDKMKCVLMLGDDCIVIVGKVLHKQYFPKSNYKYQYRVQFVGIQQSEQERIVQHIFNEQRKIMQKPRYEYDM